MKFRFAISLLLLSLCACDPCKPTRPTYAAGSFYSSDAKTLNEQLDAQLNAVPPLKKPPGKIVALISPHAGYSYSGPTAAYGYKLIEGMSFDTVIIIGPYHRAYFPGASIWKSGCWETPLGPVPIDTDLADAIIKENRSFAYSQALHLKEHSIEMEIPFLQKVLKNFKIVPILISTPSLKEAKELAQAIYKNIQGKNVLIIGSTDMSHYYPEKVAHQMDQLTLEILQSENPEELLRQDALKHIELCGLEAIATVLELAKLMGNTHLDVLHYSTSGDVSIGNNQSVVGYSSSVIYQSALSTSEQKKLLDISKETLLSFVKDKKVPDFNISDPKLEEKKAVFVTLRKNGELRGCIGGFYPTEPLYLAVRNMTIKSASQDPRFRPVRPDELKEITIEISILGPIRRIENAKEIEYGKEGVIVRQNGRSGVFLPSVAAETGWSKEEFLKHLCVEKAGLPADCWKDPKTELQVFSTYDFKD